MISQYHSERKSWVLKALSLFVIVTFLVTQSDLRLAIANPAVMNPATLASQVAADASKTDKIHYMQNLNDLQSTLQGQKGENPLQAVNSGQSQNPTPNPLTANLPSTATPDISTTFLNGVSPIVGAENKTIATTTHDSQNPDIVTVTYQDGSSFTYNSNPSSDKILSITDFTKARLNADGTPVKDAQGNPVYDLETRQFSWGVDSATGKTYVDIVTVGENGAPSTYQKFTLTSDGQLDRMLESGYLVTDPTTHQNVEVISTRDDGTDFTIYDRTTDPSFYIVSAEKSIKSTAWPWG